MAHKGYTLNYFINFFKSIPNHRWTTDDLHKHETVQYCALGHALRDERTGLIGNESVSAKAQALRNFIPDVETVNDGASYYKHLGTTPRGRVLRALRRLKARKSILD